LIQRRHEDVSISETCPTLSFALVNIALLPQMQLEKYSTRSQVLEMRNKELDAYVTKLERKLGSEKVKKGAFAAVSSTPVRRVEKESLLDALAELQEENARLHAALQVRDDNAAFHRVLEMSIGTGFY
jgi:hypothetical protein|tara:strand:+ start:420 stop:803 length:384 start_codon:yes stop_codon:yes gene_type:complete